MCPPDTPAHTHAPIATPEEEWLVSCIKCMDLLPAAQSKVEGKKVLEYDMKLPCQLAVNASVLTPLGEDTTCVFIERKAWQLPLFPNSTDIKVPRNSAKGSRNVFLSRRSGNEDSVKFNDLPYP